MYHVHTTPYLDLISELLGHLNAPMHAKIQTMIHSMARASSRCQEHEGTGNIIPRSSGVPLVQLNVHGLDGMLPSRILGLNG